MNEPRQKVSVRLRALFFGLGLGVHVVIAGFAVGGVLLGARAVQAQVLDGNQDLCMDKSECITIAEAKGGDCDGKHCFEAGHGCNGKTLGYCYAKWAPVKLAVSFGGATKVADIGDLMVKLYDWSMGVAAAVAAVMMMVGGFMYLSSFGSAEGVKKGKKYITNALIGLIITATAYTILQTINPDLVRFRLPKFPTVKRSSVPQCQKWQMCAPCGVKFFVKVPTGQNLQDIAKGGVGTADCDRYVTYASTLSEADQANYTLSSECLGAGCAKVRSTCPDTANRCIQQAKPEDGPEANCKAPVAGADVSRFCDDGNAADVCDLSCEDCQVPDSLKKATTQKQCVDKDPKPACTKVAGANNSPVDPSGITNGRYCSFCIRNGSDCNNGSKCCSGKCIATLVGSNVCSSGEAGEPCSNNQDCVTGVCNKGLLKGICTTGLAGSSCADVNDCDVAKGLKCLEGVCVDKKDYSICAKAEDCESGSCDAKLGMCKPKEGFAACDVDKKCPEGMVCNTSSLRSEPSFCTGQGYCPPPKMIGQAVCLAGTPGSRCQSDGDCFTPSQGMNVKSRGCINGVCASGNLGEACRGAANGKDAGACNEGFCVCKGFWGDKCLCLTGQQGSPCNDAAHDCRSEFKKCERNTCQP
jgi:hypothetical protein